MTDKKWYSVDDVELAKSSLDELPDLTPTRLTKSDVLEQLKDKIIELSSSKGYSVEDIRSALEIAGIKTSVKSIRDIINSRKKMPSRSNISRKKSNVGAENTPKSDEAQTPNS